MQNLVLTLLMIFLQQQLSAQSSFSGDYKYKVTYELTYQPDSTDTESKKSEEMYLYIADKTSRFSSAGKAIGDSLQSTFDYSTFDQAAFTRMMSQIPKTEFQYYIYKGVPEEKTTYVREITRDKYRYTENKNLFDWTMLGERDTIAGFQVQKATTSFAGRDYIAWFTQEIPFPEGPYKFNGLPGLIVKIADEKRHYVFEMKEMLKLEEPIPFTFKEGEFIETTPKKLLAIEEEYKKDPIGFAERSVPGLKIQYGSDTDQKKIERERKEKLKRENNPIELE